MSNTVHYRDFDLKLSSFGGSYFVEAVRTPLMEGSATLPLVLPEEIKEWRDSVKLGEVSRDVLKDVGFKLFNALFPQEIRDLWMGSERNEGGLSEKSHLRLRLDIRDYELMLIPWEILHNGEYHLAMYGRRPIVRTLYDVPVVKPAALKRPLKFLLVVSQPADDKPLAAASHEAEIVAESLKPLIEARIFAPPVRLDSPTLEGLQTELRKGYDILHFIGHGMLKKETGFLVLENEGGQARSVESEKLSYYLRDTDLRLLFFNACQTATPAQEDPMLGVGFTAIKAGVPAVVAMQGPIIDEVAAHFALSFYRTLAEDFPVEFCMSEARKALMGDSSSAYADWAIPVLFSNASEGRLWRASARRAKRLPETAVKQFSLPPEIGARSGVTRGGAADGETVGAATTTTGVLHNLTNPDYAEFVNREAERAKILEMLDPKKRTGVINVTGVGGVGRSALAHETAQRCLEFSRQNQTDPRAFRGIIRVSARRPDAGSFGEGQAPAASYWGLDDLCFTVGRTLRNLALVQASAEERVPLLRDVLSEQRYLLILCDVDEVDDARLIDFLRDMPVPSKAIVTSHAPLDIGEQKIGLLSLKIDDAVELLKQDADKMDVPALGDASRAELEQLATAADCLPLILRWSVVQLRESGQTVSWMSSLLAQAGNQSLAEYCLGELFAILTPSERNLLFAFALLPAPLTAELAGAVAGLSDEERPRSLARLVNLRLVWLDETSARYQMLFITRRFTLREFERDATFRDEATRRAVGEMLAFTETNGGRGDWNGHERIEAQVRNVMWAAAKASELREWKMVLRFRKALDQPFYTRGYWNEAIQIGTLAFHAAEQLNDTDSMGWSALYPVAQMNLYQGKYREAEQWCRLALKLFAPVEEKDDRSSAPKAGKDYETAAAERLLGRVMIAVGQFDEAEKLFADALRKTQAFSTNDDHLNQQADVLSSLAGLAEQRGQIQQASDGYTKALELFKQTRNPLGISAMLHHLGSIALAEKQYAVARSRFQESLDALGASHTATRNAKVIYSMALLEEEENHLEKARELLLEARAEFQRLSAAADLARTEVALTRVTAAINASRRDAGGH